MKDNINITLLDRFMRGETSGEEEQMLLAWFRNDVAREEILDLYRSRWQEAKDVELDDEVLNRMISQTKARIHQSKPMHKPVRIALWTKYVAAIIFILGIGFSSYLFTGRPMMEDVKEYVVEADKGQRAGVTLPDGTKVWLNSHTQLSYTTDYGRNERSVSLNGEAYFEVAKDKNKRFVVKTDIMDVEALGTSFNVKAYKADDRLTTTLFTGSVRVSACDKSVVLQPDQQVQVSRKERNLKVGMPVNSRYANMWRDNELAFNKETFEDIAVVLNRLYNVQIIFESEKIKQYRFSGVIKNNSLDNVIEIISLTAPITYKSRGDTIILDVK